LDEAYRQQLRHWRSALHSGADRVGWKIGFNAPSLQRQLGLQRPAVGHLTTATLVGADGSHSLAGAEHPLVEPELAIEVGPDGRVSGLGAAFEVIDMDRALTAETAAEVVAANIFHRAAVIRPSHEPIPLDGITAKISGGREQRDPVSASAVDVEGTVALTLETLEQAGESLQAGDRIIAGALTPPLPVEPGDLLRLDLGPLGTAELALAP